MILREALTRKNKDVPSWRKKEERLKESSRWLRRLLLILKEPRRRLKVLLVARKRTFLVLLRNLMTNNLWFLRCRRISRRLRAVLRNWKRNLKLNAKHVQRLSANVLTLLVK